ncbi:hypothetical protein, partial [Streptomyces sp900116325]|uniref:hypothetical protein n=1 Tax=Streptomyces sp. 900116325 TaxID=3154295 RepID=UPI0033B4B9CC
AGFRNAWSAVADSNVTTLIAAGLLFFLGSGPCRRRADQVPISRRLRAAAPFPAPASRNGRRIGRLGGPAAILVAA